MKLQFNSFTFSSTETCGKWNQKVIKLIILKNRYFLFSKISKESNSTAVLTRVSEPQSLIIYFIFQMSKFNLICSSSNLSLILFIEQFKTNSIELTFMELNFSEKLEVTKCAQFFQVTLN